MAHLVRIGNSWGMRIPQAILQQTGFDKNMKLVFTVIEGGGLLISPETQARDGWEQKFSSHQKTTKNPLLLGDFQNKFDRDEWEW